MNYFDLRNKRKKKLSFNNLKDNKEIEKELYQKYLRANKTKEKYVDSEHLENIFTNEIYYRAMKEIPKIEKQILYMSVYEYRTLNEICKILKKTKRRLTSPAFLDVYQNILIDNGELILKTDNRLLFEYSLVSFQNYGLHPRNANLMIFVLFGLARCLI